MDLIALKLAVLGALTIVAVSMALSELKMSSFTTVLNVCQATFLITIRITILSRWALLCYQDANFKKIALPRTSLFDQKCLNSLLRSIM